MDTGHEFHDAWQKRMTGNNKIGTKIRAPKAAGKSNPKMTVGAKLKPMSGKGGKVKGLNPQGIDSKPRPGN